MAAAAAFATATQALAAEAQAAAAVAAPAAAGDGGFLPDAAAQEAAAPPPRRKAPKIYYATRTHSQITQVSGLAGSAAVAQLRCLLCACWHGLVSRRSSCRVSLRAIFPSTFLFPILAADRWSRS